MKTASSESGIGDPLFTGPELRQLQMGGVLTWRVSYLTRVYPVMGAEVNAVEGVHCTQQGLLSAHGIIW